jgi:zinc protease
MKRSLLPGLAGLLALLAGGPSLLATPTQDGEPLRFELANGLRVWVQEEHRRPVALVQVSYRVGSINEGPGLTGTAHYVEHMVYRATENISNEDIYGFVDRIGGRWTGGTGSTATTYGETVPSWALEEALRISAERMGRALFDPVEFDRERNNVVTEANGFSDSGPLDALRDAVMLASFEVHPYRYGSNTWARDNLDLNRDEAFAFYQSYYGPNNAVLVVVGDVEVDEVRRLVDNHFGPLHPAPHSGEVRVVEPPQRVEKRVVLTYPVDEQRLEIVYRAPAAASPDYPLLVVVDRILAPRLQAAFAAAGGDEITTSHRATPYPFVYRITGRAGSDVDVERLAETIRGEIDRLGRDGAGDEELAAARAAAEQPGGGPPGEGSGTDSAVPPRSFPGLSGLARQLDRREVFPWEVDPRRPAQVREAEAGVTASGVRDYVRRWLRRSQRTVGLLVNGPADNQPQWSDGRAIVGERLAVPPMTTTPARRHAPAPVPGRALEPLPPLEIPRDGRTLANGVVMSAARGGEAAGALHVRVGMGAADPTGKEGLTALLAQLIAGDPRLAAFQPRAITAGVANDSFFDITLRFAPAATAAASAAMAGALGAPSFADARVERARLAAEVDSRAPGPGEQARARVLATVVPSWRLDGRGTPASLAEVTADNLEAAMSGIAAVTVAVVGPDDPSELLDLAASGFAVLPALAGAGPLAGAPRVSTIGLGPPVGALPISVAGSSSVQRGPASEIRVAVPGATQVAVVAGLPGVGRDHPDRRALELLNYIAGVPYYGGRLGWALTKSGLTYSSAAATTFGATAGHVLFTTECDTANLAATLQAIREVIAGVGEDGVTEWELREAQAFTSGRTLLYGPGEDSDAATLATALLDERTLGEDGFGRGSAQEALAVTLEEINDVARRHYRPELLAIAAIGAIPERPAPSPFPAGTFRALFER